MRKKTVTHVAKSVFWYALYFLPVLAYLIFIFSNPLVENTGTENESSAESVIVAEDPSYVQQRTATIRAGASCTFSMSTYSYMPCLASMTIVTYDNTFLQYYLPVWVCTDTYYNSFNNTQRSALNNTIVLSQSSGTDSYVLAYDWSIVMPENSYYFKYTVSLYNISGNSGVTSFPTTVSGMRLGSISLSYDMQNFDNLQHPVYHDFYVFESLPDLSPVLPSSNYDFETFVRHMGFEFATDNIVVNSLEDMFGSEGILPLFNDSAPFIILAWYVCVFLLHLAVDFLLFIPKYAHKWMGEITGE